MGVRWEFVKQNDHSFFQNHQCKYFPCHKTQEEEIFNCLFCYCPLYALGSECGGNFRYTETGVKDCSACTLPHGSEGYAHILKNFPKVAELASKNQ